MLYFQKKKKKFQNVGLHFPEIPDGVSTDCLCVVSSYKYKNFKKKISQVEYKDYLVKRVKSAIMCHEGKRHLCVKQGSTCWQDLHIKVEYWR